jgi:hypothetical protein
MKVRLDLLRCVCFGLKDYCFGIVFLKFFLIRSLTLNVVFHEMYEDVTDIYPSVHGW